MNVTEQQLQQAGYTKRRVSQLVWEWFKEPPYRHHPPFKVYIRTSEGENGPWIAHLQLGRLDSVTLPLAGLESFEDLETAFRILAAGVAITPQGVFEQQQAGEK